MSWSLCWELAHRNHSVAFNLVNVLLDEGICRQPFSTLWAGFWAISFFFIYTAFTTETMFRMACKTEIGCKFSVAELLWWG